MVALRLDDIEGRLAGSEPRRLLSAPEAPSAAVAAVLRPAGDDVEALFIRRAENPHDPWSGHMAFPGGRRDPGDRDLVETALRETREELGLDLASTARRLGYLDEIEAIARGRRTGLIIRPYVFALEVEDVALHPNHEVAEALWVPLGPLVRGEASTDYRYQRQGLDVVLPAYLWEGRVVWGLTYQMLQVLFRACGR
jgi:8-oxo-dGTP pyrophosphatase MutT (NUDIX family)